MTFEGTFQENKRPVVTTAPDCLVYLNGRTDVPSGSDPNKRVNIQPLVKSVSTNVGVQNPPGNAQVELHVPTHYKDDLFRAGDPILTTMMELQIYMKGHYKVGGEPRYYPTFWGVTQSVNHSYSAGERTISLSAQDILYWWNIQRINVNPSVKGAGTTQIGEFNVQGNGYFTNANPFSIMYTLARTAYGDSMNANIYPGSKHQRSETSEGELQKLMEYWTEKWGRIRHSLRMFGPSGEVIQGSDLAELVDDRASELKSGKKSKSSEKKGKTHKTYEQAGAVDLSQVSPFEQIAGKMANSQVFDSEFKTKMDIANTVADSIGYEFFMDTTGELVFKPPFYNLDVIPNKPVSWVRDIDIIDEDYNENPPEATMIEATGSLKRNWDLGGGDIAKPRGTYVDYRLVQKYGWKPTNYSSNFYGSGISGDAKFRLFYHLIDRLDRENKSIHTGSVTIPLRPEMRAGYPIYIEHKDAFYYVNSISHTFNYGSQCTTTLELNAKRSKFYAPFDSWAAASNNDQAGQQPEPGDTAPAGKQPVNIYNRPIEDRTGNPEPDKNVNFVFQAKSEEEKEAEREQGKRSQEESEKESERVQRNLVSMRSQFALNTPVSYVYQVDPDREEDVERDEDTGEKVAGPLTFVEPEKVELEDGTEAFGAKYPVSDERGYEVIGGYEYGRSASITLDGLDFNADDTYSDVQRLLHMEPDDNDATDVRFTGTNFEVDPSKDQNLKINPNNYGRRLTELEPQGKEAPSKAANSRSMVKGKDKKDYSKEQQSVEAIDVSTDRNFSHEPQVEKWKKKGTLEKARNIAGVSEEKYPDRLLLSIIHVESQGKANARRKLRDDQGNVRRDDQGNVMRSQFVGSFQIGRSNAKGSNFEYPNDFMGKSSDDEEAVLNSAVHFMKVQEKEVSTHNYNEEIMALGWNAGFGTAREMKSLKEEGASESEIVNFLENKFPAKKERGNTPADYIDKYREARSVWNNSDSVSPKNKIKAKTIPDVFGGNIAEGKLEDGSPLPGAEANLKSNYFRKELEENLSDTPNSLPSGIKPPRDPSIFPIINKYLKSLYQQAFEEEESPEMKRVRGANQQPIDNEDQSEQPQQERVENDIKPDYFNTFDTDVEEREFIGETDDGEDDS